MNYRDRVCKENEWKMGKYKEGILRSNGVLNLVPNLEIFI